MITRENITFRYDVQPSDPTIIEEIVRSTGFFYEHEIPVAAELAIERLAKGIESGYLFVFAEINGKVISYSCYGLTPCTVGTYDLYWIVTHNNYRGKGAGVKVLQETIRQIKLLAGRMLIAETSTKDQYKPTRSFYEKNGFICEAEIRDFYAPGDGKAMYVLRRIE
ncbi:MAG: GNAT family N-acetyltransferase [Sphingobacteriia bacterium]|nr:GNAT family N-acetyltransferase [Sphingobacteriia bacterium]